MERVHFLKLSSQNLYNFKTNIRIKMNEIVFFSAFIVLTIMHVIGDFRTPYRGLNFSSWKAFFLSEYVLVLNPLHGLWDAFSPFRRHPKYLLPIDTWSTKGTKYETPQLQWDSIDTDVASSKELANGKWMITDKRFWFWLGIDQGYHVLSNLLVAWILGECF